MILAGRRLGFVIRKSYPEIKYNFGVYGKTMTIYNVKIITFSMLKVISKMGSRETTIDYLNNYMDVEKIINLDDFHATALLNQLIRFTSNFILIWMVMILSILCGFIITIF